MPNTLSLRRWLIGAYLVLAVIIALVSREVYRAQEEQLRLAAHAELAIVSELKAEQIVYWRNERLADGHLLMQSSLILPELRQWMATPTPQGREHLLALFSSLREIQKYANIILIDRDGALLLSLDEDDDAVDRATRQAMAQAFVTRAPQLTDLHLHETNGHPHLAVVVPVFGWHEAGIQPLAALILEIEPEEYLYPLIDVWPTPSESGETLLLSREGDGVLFLNRLQFHESGLPLRVSLPLTQTDAPAVMAVLGRRGPVEGVDYHGEAVVAFIRTIPDSPWYLVTKKDRAEVFAGVLPNLLSLLLGLGLVIVAVTLFGLILYQARERRHLSALYHAQTELNAKRAELDAFFTQSTGLLCIADADGYFRRLNPAWAEQLGWDPEAVVGRHCTELMHPDDAAAIQIRLAELVGGQPAPTFVNRYRHADGSYHWLEWRSVVAGRQLFATARDITAERAAAETLRQSEARLRLAAQLTNTMVAVSDRELRYTWAYNTQLIGLEPDALFGKRDDKVFGPENAVDMLALRRHVMATGMRIRRELWMEIGVGPHVFDTVFEPIVDADGIVTGMTVVALDITAHRRMEDALRRSQEQVRLAADLIGMTIAMVDRNLRYTWVHNTSPGAPGSAARLGRRDDEIFGAENAANVIALRRQVLDSGQRVRGETTLLLEDGRRFFDVVYDPIFDDAGEVAGMIGVGVDITERKQAADALRRSEEMFRLLADNAGDIVYRVRYQPTMQFEYVSPSVTAITGYTPEEHYADPQLGIKLVHPDDRAVLQAVTADPPDKPIVLRWVRKDGSVIWTEQTNTLLYDEAGEVVALQGIARDITERKLAEDALRQSEAQLRLQAAQIAQIVESVPEGVLLLDPDGRIVLANPQAQADLAAVADIRVGQALRQVGDRSLVELLGVAEGEWQELRVADRIFETAARALRPEGVAQGWVLVLRDVTQERVAETARQHQARLVAVGQLAAGIAHDFNNILAVILLQTELTMRSPRLNESERERLATILRQSRQAAELVQQILDFSRQSILTRRSTALDFFLSEQIGLLRRTLPENILVSLVISPHGPGYGVYADRTRLAQMILNLATNARDAMPDGGELRFELSRFEVARDKSADVPDLPLGDWIALRVCDTGTGIAPEHLSRLFNPFFTTKDLGKGTGLGLAQVYGIVRQHGGTIDVVSGLNEGTTFRIYLPAHDEPAEITASILGALAEGHGETILLVEDEAGVRAALADTLRHWGYAVQEASNGEEALTMLAGEHGDIRLVLSDVIMPVMGGVALARAMRAQGLDQPVVLLTGHPLGDGQDQLPPGTISATLTKPPAPDHLSQAIAQALDGA